MKEFLGGPFGKLAGIEGLMTAGTGTTTATATTTTTPLGPGDLSQLFTIPQATWTAWNRRAGLAGAPTPFGEAFLMWFSSYSKRDQFAQACAQWLKTTYPGLVGMARQMPDVAGAMQDALKLLGAVSSGGSVPQAQSAVAAAKAQVDRMTSTAEDLQQQIANFVLLNQGADQNLQVYFFTAFVKFNTAPTEPLGAASTLVLGAWHDLTLQLETAQTALAQAGTAVSNFMARVNVASAIQLWDAAAGVANEFVSQATGQTPNLDGDFVYDDTIVEENTWYHFRIGPTTQGATYALVTESGHPGTLGVTASNNPGPAGCWQFIRAGGYGCYRVVNQAAGGNDSLDATSGPCLASTDSSRMGQLWRIYGLDGSGSNKVLGCVGRGLYLGISQPPGSSKIGVNIGIPNVMMPDPSETYLLSIQKVGS